MRVTVGAANWSQRPQMFLFVSKKGPGRRESFTLLSRRQARPQTVNPPPQDQRRLFVHVSTARESDSATNTPAAEQNPAGFGEGEIIQTLWTGFLLGFAGIWKHYEKFKQTNLQTFWMLTWWTVLHWQQCERDNGNLNTQVTKKCT